VLLVLVLCQSWVMRKLFPLTLLNLATIPSSWAFPGYLSTTRKSIGPINQLSLPLRTVWHSACGIPADLRNSGNLSGSIASGTPPLNNSKSGLVTVPHTPVSRQATVPPIHIIPAPPRRSLVSAAAFRSALKTARVYGVTTTPELKQYHQSPSY